MFKRLLRRGLIGSLILMVLAVAGGALFWSDLQRYARTPISTTATERAVRIPPGTGFTALCDLLVDQGLVRHPQRFRLLARLRGVDKQLKAGDYRLSSDLSPDEVLAALVSGREHLHRLTIPEGYNLKQIAVAVAEAGFGDAQAFLKMASDPTVAKAHVASQIYREAPFPDPRSDSASRSR